MPEGLETGEATALDEALRAAHRRLSEEDLAFRDWAMDDPEMRAGETFRRLAKGFPLLVPEEQQPWPTLLGGARRAEIAATTERFCRLLREVPRRVFDGDAARIAQFYNLGSPFIVDMILEPPNGLEESVGRGDMVDGPRGLQFIEFNFTISLGGWDARFMGELHSAVPAFRDFARHRGIELVPNDPAKAFLRHLVSCARKWDLGTAAPLHAAVLLGATKHGGQSASQGFARLQTTFSEIAAEQKVEGGKILPCRLADLSVQRGQVIFQGLPVAVIVELEDIAPPAIYSLYKQQRVVVLNGPVDRILGTKRNFALLSAAHEDSWDADELEFIARTVPWTREVRPGTVCYQRESRDLTDLMVANRERLVLKKGVSQGGQDVVVGLDTPPSPWQSTVDRALREGGWVVQERIESWPFLYQNAELGCVPHNVIWGPFIFGGKSQGVHVRVHPRGRGLVSVHSGATQSVVFEV
jgi:hypothetical protein